MVNRLYAPLLPPTSGSPRPPAALIDHRRGAEGLEDAGVLSWVQRIKRVREPHPDLLGDKIPLAGAADVERRQFPRPRLVLFKSEKPTGTRIKTFSLNKRREGGSRWSFGVLWFDAGGLHPYSQMRRLRRAMLWAHHSSAQAAKQGFPPDVLVTDRLRSYGAAKAEIGLSARHERGLRKNNRAENSHQPTRG